MNIMASDEDVFSNGFSASSYSENPYDEDSEEFDQFEKVGHKP
jgi:hypothetical protein